MIRRVVDEERHGGRQENGGGPGQGDDHQAHRVVADARSDLGDDVGRRGGDDDAIGGGEMLHRIVIAIRRAREDERVERNIVVSNDDPVIEDAPDDEKMAAEQGLSFPRPYRRLRPEYPESAARADVEAIVDVLVDVRADGEVGDVRVARWAGFGLDDITVATVRKMHFFPAKKNGSPVPMRVLLRYNFRKPPR